MHLLLDSSGAYLLAGLQDGAELVAEVREPARPPEGRDIGSVVQALLTEQGRPQLSGITVGLGPGSFIGTRVAISYANGYAAASGVPLSGVDSLEAIAAQHASRLPVLRDARRGQWYLYQPGPAAGHSRCLSLADLDLELRQLQPAAVLLEGAPAATASPATRSSFLAVAALLRELGVTAIDTEGPDCAGLAAASPISTCTDYVEPVYLRGYL
jgi:tRNA threonylcarbamoyladenosine biosynthesis protein TsaB